MAKKFKAIVRLQLEAGKANPAPPVGPALASHGINIMAFVRNITPVRQTARAKFFLQKSPFIPMVLSLLCLSTPPAAVLLRKAANVEKGSGVPNKEKVGKVTRAQMKEIAELKMKDLNAINLEGAMKQIEGTARSMGITVTD